MKEIIFTSVIGALSAIIGAAIGGVCTYKGTIKAISMQFDREDKKKEEERINTKKKLLKTITTVLDKEIHENRVQLTEWQLHNEYQLELKFKEYEKIRDQLIEYDMTVSFIIIQLYYYFEIINSQNKELSRESIEGLINHVFETYKEYQKILFSPDILK